MKPEFPAADDPMPPAREVTALLRRWSAGERAALDELMPLVYDELRRLAGQHMRRERIEHTLPRTGLVHEAYERLAGQQQLDLRCRAQFFGFASSLMRHILVDHSRARRAAKRDGGVAVTDALESVAVEDDAIDLIALDESLRRLEALDAQQARVVEMRFFVGMGVDDTAEALGLSASTVKREWATARAWLLRDMGRPAATRVARDTTAPEPA